MFNFSKRILAFTFSYKDVFRIHQCRSKATKSRMTINNLTSTHAAQTCGQPTPSTHPHLLQNGEITPLIQLNEFQDRRQKLIESILSESCKTNVDFKSHLVVIPSASKQYMSDKIPYVFRQNSDFLYLTGCMEPDSCLVLSTTNSTDPSVVLFMREKDSHSELWDGPRTGTEDSISLFGVNESLPISELGNYIQCYMKSNPKYDYMTPVQQSVHTVMIDCLNAKSKKMWEPPNHSIHKLRLIKSPAEIKLMQKSCDIASSAIHNTISFSKPGHSEHQIFANVEYECKMNGAEYLAYPPVVAGGNRANIIHYINNNQIVTNGEMVLMDAGCEYHGYSSDITRTWPINGKFSPQQTMVYEALLYVHSELIKLCQNFPTLDYLFDSMCKMLGIQLQKIGLIPKNTPEEVLIKMAYQFCPHHVSHYLGMDVHDTPTIPRSIKIRPGMIITIEPGVYINHKHKVPKEFQGMGIRIEDDVLITEDGPLVLTRNCPRTIEDIQRIASENQ